MPKDAGMPGCRKGTGYLSRRVGRQGGRCRMPKDAAMPKRDRLFITPGRTARWAMPDAEGCRMPKDAEENASWTGTGYLSPVAIRVDNRSPRRHRDRGRPARFASPTRASLNRDRLIVTLGQANCHVYLPLPSRSIPEGTGTAGVPPASLVRPELR
jgi:hypothetical protein